MAATAIKTGTPTDAPINFSQPARSAASAAVAEILEREMTQQTVGPSLAGRATFKPENVFRQQKCEENQARIELVRTLLKSDKPRIPEAEIHLNQIVKNYSYLNRSQQIDVILISYAMSLYPDGKKWEFLCLRLNTAPYDQGRSSWRKNFARKSL